MLVGRNRKKRILWFLKDRRSLEEIIDKHFSYVQLIRELLLLQEEGLIVYDGDKFILTSNGQEYLTKNNFEVIKPLDVFKCEKKSVDDVYIPCYIKEAERTEN